MEDLQLENSRENLHPTSLIACTMSHYLLLSTKLDKIKERKKEWKRERKRQGECREFIKIEQVRRNPLKKVRVKDIFSYLYGKTTQLLLILIARVASFIMGIAWWKLKVHALLANVKEMNIYVLRLRHIVYRIEKERCFAWVFV